MIQKNRLAEVATSLIFLSFTLFGQFTSAQNYDLGNDVLDEGGVKMTSGSYILRGSLAQSTIGKVSSPNYIANIGFWHPYPVPPGVEEEFPDLYTMPKTYSLSQNYPNPVLHSTTIRYGLPKESLVDLRIFNISGQEVRNLVNGKQKQGFYRVTWDLRGESGKRLPNGVYFYRMSVGANGNSPSFIKTLKLVILR